MRSRDGNRTFSLSVCTLILFSALSLYADEYLISYRYVLKDARLYNESLDISRAMKKCEGVSLPSLVIHSDNSKDIKKSLLQNSSEFIDYLHRLGLHVQHQETTQNRINQSQTILTLKTMCFKVDFNDNLAIITPLK